MKSIKQIWKVVSTVFVGIILFLAIAFVGIRIFGLKPYTVLSGSMEPTYKTGSIVFVKSVDYHDLAVGDPITFMLNEDTTATHRIIEIVPIEDSDLVKFRTKGDNNDTADEGAVHCNNVIGKAVFSIPVLGYVANFIQDPAGRIVSIAVCLLVLLAAFVPDILGSKKDKESN